MNLSQRPLSSYSVADQLVALVQDARGEIDLLMPLTTRDERIGLAALEWCHQFVLGCNFVALVDLSMVGSGQIKVSYGTQYKVFVALTDADINSIFSICADAEILVCVGLDTALNPYLKISDQTVHFLARSAWRYPLVVAPVIEDRTTKLGQDIRMTKLVIQTEALFFPPNKIEAERSALLTAALIHRIGEIGDNK